MKDLSSIVAKFKVQGTVEEIKPLGAGLINDTYKVVYSVDGKNVKYIFQKINTKVFRKPENLMENVSRVLDHSAKKLGSLPDSERRCIHLVPTVDGKMYYIDGDECWRSYKFIDNARTYNTLETEEQRRLVLDRRNEKRPHTAPLRRPHIGENLIPDRRR